MNKLVYIIILNWNGWQDTLACIESCLKLTYPCFRILVIDNGSNDGSEANIRRHFPDIEILQTGKNLGFAGGNNVGIMRALERNADYVWLLNNDTVVHSEALTELLKVADESDQVAITGSKIYYYLEPNKIWFAGGFWRRNKYFSKQRGEGEIDSGQYDEICDVDFITGCSLLIKTSAIKQVGLMDERYFLYWEDVDWNTTVFNSGWKIIYVPRSIVRHKVSSSISNRSVPQIRCYIRSTLMFFKKHRYRRFILLFFGIPFIAIIFHLTGRSQIVRGYFAGWLDFIMNRSFKTG